MSQYGVLKEGSIMLIGERYPARVVWLQLFDASNSVEEEEMRHLLIDISHHIAKGNIHSGSARKFLDGKLIYYEAENPLKSSTTRVYVIFTQELSIKSPVKKALQAISLRGGVYSAKRFFSEMIDLLEDEGSMRDYDQITVEEAIETIEVVDYTKVDANELGYIISVLNRSEELDVILLEKIYLIVYEIILVFSKAETEIDDPDEFLDAAFSVGLRYLERKSFHLALELFKLITVVSSKNFRYDLEVACRIQISIIYKDYFPMSGQYILETLEEIEQEHLAETNNRLKEIYYCLQGYAYAELENHKLAIEKYEEAIDVADQEINAHGWIAEAYFYLARLDEVSFFYKRAIRGYLTASTIAFTGGNLKTADHYRNSAAKVEMAMAHSIAHVALINRMDSDNKDAEFRAWEALRLTVKAYIHSSTTDLHNLKSLADAVLSYTSKVLGDSEDFEQKKVVIENLSELIKTIHLQVILPGNEQEKLEKITKDIEANIPLPPPTFLLLSIDGRLMTIGKIDDEGWLSSDLEGTLLSGILSAIMSLINEVTHNSSSLRTVDAGNTQIMIEQSENIVAVLLVDRDIQEFRDRLIELLHFIDQKFGDKLRVWDGNISQFEIIKSKAQKMLAPSVIASQLDQIA